MTEKPSPRARLDNRRDKDSSSGVKKKERPFLIKSLVLHLVIIFLLLFSWHSSDPIKQYSAPASVQARVLSAAELKQLDARRVEKETKLEDKKKAKDKAALAAKKKKLAVKKKKALAKKKKAEAKKRADAKKKALIQKKEKAKKEKVKKAKQEEAKKKQTLKEAQLLEAEKKQEALRQLKEKEEAEKASVRKKVREKREDQLAKRLAAANAKEAAISNSTARSKDSLDEEARFAALIRSRIEARWHIPPKSRGRSVELRLNLLPSGELSGVSVSGSSGSNVFDQSALNAVKSVKRFPVPTNPALFDQAFRQFSMRFSPPSE